MRRVDLYKFWLRVKTAYKILTKPKLHWILINFDDEALVNLLRNQDDKFDADATYHGLQNYLVWRSLQLVANSMDEDDMILEKAKFEGKFEEWEKNVK